MRRPTSALAKAVLGTALAASTVSAQQSSPASVPGLGPIEASATSTPVNPARGARHLLRNGWDYVNYQEYDRALAFFREAESRAAELNDAERTQLKQGIERAQRGLRELANGMKTGPSYARTSRARPGALAAATPPAPASRYEREPIQLAAATSTAMAPATAPAPLMAPANLPPVPDVEPLALASAPAPGQVQVQDQAATESPAALAPGVLPPLADATIDTATRQVEAQVPMPAPPTGGLELPPPPHLGNLPELPAAAGPNPSAVAPPIAELPAPAAELPPPAGFNPPPSPAPASLDAPSLPQLPREVADRPSTRFPDTLAAAPTAPAAPLAVEHTPAAEPTPLPAPAAPSASPTPSASSSDRPAPAVTDTPPAPIEPPPAAEAPPVAEVRPADPARPRPRFGIDTLIPERDTTPRVSTLSPELQREVEQLAQRQDEELRRRAEAKPADPLEPGTNNTGGPSSTRLEITRAPSPTEARPIRAIPVPEEFVTLPKREWEPNRKYWSAAATCHLPLYFQDAALERYGYSVEQHFGPAGRFMSIPLDDPRQSKQRNQIAQPFFSAGLFAAQIALLPYNMIMDPPWEAEYDLGYYRPGDRVPTDVFYLPLFGVGPPLQGKNYGLPPQSGPSLPQSRWGG